MSRLVTLMSCQWADMDLDTLCAKAKDMGYDGIELAIWGNHLDAIRAAEDDEYVASIKAVFDKYGLVVKALCSHVPSQCVGDYGDPRLDKRIDFVGGIRGLGELKRRVDSGEMKVALALHPVTMQQIIDIADSGNIMPPKTTWFEPKLRSGLIIHELV